MNTQAFSIKFQINEEKFTFVSLKLFSLNDLLKFFSYEKQLILVEYNGKICNTKQGYELLIQNNDKIEIITIVGGG